MITLIKNWSKAPQNSSNGQGMILAYSDNKGILRYLHSFQDGWNWAVPILALMYRDIFFWITVEIQRIVGYDWSRYLHRGSRNIQLSRNNTGLLNFGNIGISPLQDKWITAIWDIPILIFIYILDYCNCWNAWLVSAGWLAKEKTL